jgi:glucokinase
MTVNPETVPYYLGIDLGGTYIKAGVVSDTGESLSYVREETEATLGPENGVANIIRAAQKAVTDSPLSIDDIIAVGLATPGTMDIPAGMLIGPHNLPGWNNIPIRQLVADALNKPAVLQNDANAAAYGEYWVGGGRHAHSLVLWTLGTGIGCGIIVHDLILEGEHSHGSECGHIIIQMDGGRICATGHRGTLEAYAGAKAVIERCREALGSGRASLLTEMLDRGDELSPLLIAQAAEQGDAVADEIVMETARYLGVGVTSVMHTINPSMVLFGGAMTFGRNETELGRRFLARIKEEVSARAFPVPAERTVLEYAKLGGDAGYIGAAGCARRAFGSSS